MNPWFPQKLLPAHNPCLTLLELPIDRIVCGAPDRRSLYRIVSCAVLSAFQHYSNLPLASSLSQSLYSSPRSYPLPSWVLIRRPSPLLPFAPDSLIPLPPFILAWAFWTLPVTLPVNHTFHFSSLFTAYTGPVIHCLPLCPFRPSSVFQTSVCPGFLIPFAFYTPPWHSSSPPNVILEQTPHAWDWEPCIIHICIPIIVICRSQMDNIGTHDCSIWLSRRYHYNC